MLWNFEWFIWMVAWGIAATVRSHRENIMEIQLHYAFCCNCIVKTKPCIIRREGRCGISKVSHRKIGEISTFKNVYEVFRAFHYNFRSTFYSYCKLRYVIRGAVSHPIIYTTVHKNATRCCMMIKLCINKALEY